MPTFELDFSAALDHPFPGLRAFEPAESFLFFGRQQHTNELLRLLSTRRMLAVIGTSGGGKSSLVRAGLLPALYRGHLAGAGSRWRIAVMRPGSSPLDELAKALVEGGILNEDQRAAGRKTIGTSSLGLVEAIREAGAEEASNILLVVDQFEELFRFRWEARPDRSAEEALFVAALLEAVDQLVLPIYVVLTMRSDFLGDCARFEGLTEALNRSQYLVPRLTREERQEAIEGPLRIAGATITARLVQRLLNDAGDDPDQLPELQHAMSMTFHRWKEQGRKGDIDLVHYNDVGGMANAIDRHAQAIYESLPPEDQACTQRLFRCLTATESGRPVRRPAPLERILAVVSHSSSDSQERVQRIILRLATPEHSLLVLSTSGNLDPTTVVDISHECLIRKWVALQQWVADEGDSAEWYRSLVRAARQYAAGTGGLWRDPDLKQALQKKTRDGWNAEWAAQYSHGFDKALDFLNCSRSAQRRTRAATAGAVLLVLMAALAGYWRYQRDLQRDSILELQLHAQLESARTDQEDARRSVESLQEELRRTMDPKQRKALEEALSDVEDRFLQSAHEAENARKALDSHQNDAASKDALLNEAKGQVNQLQEQLRQALAQNAALSANRGAPSAPAVPPSRRIAFPPSYAVVIGISHYKNLAEVQQLRFADRDAQSIYSALISPEGGNFKAENVHLLTNEKATLANMRSEIGGWLPSVAKDTDRVLIYFAGHGVWNQGKGVLGPYDLDVKNLADTTYPMDELGSAIGSQIKGKFKILLIDAGHSGAISTSNSGEASQMPSGLDRSIFSLTGSRSREQSYEASDLDGGHGVFSYYLVKGLEGAADANGDGVVTADELSEYVREQVRTYTAGRQNPTSDRGDFDPDMILAYVPAVAKPARPVAPVSGALVFNANTDGVEILVDGKSSGVVSKDRPFRLAGLSPGEHTVKGIKAGYEPDGPRQVTVYPGQDATISIVILPAQKHNPTAVALLDQGLAYSKKGTRRDYQKAIELFDKALKTEPTYSQPAYYLGLTYDVLFDQGRAKQYFELALKINPDYLDARTSYGSLLLNMGNTDEALRQLSMVIQSHPKDGNALTRLAAAYRLKGTYPKSIDAARKAISASPQSAEPHFWLADSLRLSGKYSEALLEFDNYLKLSELNSKPVGTLRFTYLLMGSKGKTAPAQQDDWKDLRSLAYLGLCDSERMLKNLDLAIRNCQTALTYNAQDAFAHYALGLCYMRKAVDTGSIAELDPAIKHFQQVIEINPDFSEAGSVRQSLASIQTLLSQRTPH